MILLATLVVWVVVIVLLARAERLRSNAEHESSRRGDALIVLHAAAYNVSTNQFAAPEVAEMGIDNLKHVLADTRNTVIQIEEDEW